MKQALASILKVVAGIAGLVFFLAPVANMGILVSIAALVVAIIAGVTGHHLSDDEDSSNSGFWPKDPSSPKLTFRQVAKAGDFTYRPK